MASKLKIIPLGGLGEIGKNLTVYEYGKDMFLVDCGMGFPDQDLYGVGHQLPEGKQKPHPRHGHHARA